MFFLVHFINCQKNIYITTYVYILTIGIYILPFTHFAWKNIPRPNVASTDCVIDYGLCNLLLSGLCFFLVKVFNDSLEVRYWWHFSRAN